MNQKKLILICRDSVQNSLLKNYLADCLGCSSQLFDSETSFGNLFRSDPETLVLLEAPTATRWSLEKYIDLICKWHSHCQIALYNVEAAKVNVSLLDWPQVRGLFLHNHSEQLLVRGLQHIFEGEYWFPRDVTARFIETHRAPTDIDFPSSAHLTKRELNILSLLGNGMSNTAIAVDLHLSEHTVKTHVYNIFKKLNVSNRVQAANHAKRLTGAVSNRFPYAKAN